MNRQKRADLMLVMITLFWGASYFLMDVALTDLQPLNLNAFRFIAAFAVLGIVFRIHGAVVNEKLHLVRINLPDFGERVGLLV